MAIDVDKVKWADNLEVDPVSGLPNKSEPPEELKLSGTKRTQNLTRQHLNYLADQYHEMLGDLQQQINDLTVSAGVGTLNAVFPVGSYWFNGSSDADPSVSLGFGTWVRVLGKFIVGVDEGDVTWDVGLKVGGAKNHAHTASSSSAGSHSHGALTGNGGIHSHSSATGSAGGHSHTMTNGAWPTGDVPSPSNAATDGTLVAASGSFEVGETLNSLKFTAGEQVTGSVSNHSHSISSDGNHNHAISADGSHTHTITVTNAANIPPFEAAFIWRRTA